jgi:hypothetical protein
VDGPLTGLEGVLLQVKPGKGLLVVSLELLQRSVAVEVDCTRVVSIGTPRRASPGALAHRVIGAAGMTVASRRVVVFSLAVTFVAGHGAALSRLRAQEDGVSPHRVTPLFSTSQRYDSNLFSTALDPQGDFITRVSPGIEGEYRSPRFSLMGRYALDLERFATHPELSTADGRQQATIDLRTSRSRRLEFAVDAAYTRTRTPGDLSAGTGLTLARPRPNTWRCIRRSCDRSIRSPKRSSTTRGPTNGSLAGPRPVPIGQALASIDTSRGATWSR